MLRPYLVEESDNSTHWPVGIERRALREIYRSCMACGVMAMAFSDKLSDTISKTSIRPTPGP